MWPFSKKEPYEPKCRCCGGPGILAQGPWPVPFSECYCDICYELEAIAFQVWLELNPEPEQWPPIPFMESKEDMPLSKSLEEIKAFFRNKLGKTHELDISG